VSFSPCPFTLGRALDRVDAGPFTITRSSYAAGQVLPAHAHAQASATIVMRGVVTERVDGRRFECNRDRFLVRPAELVHDNAYGPRGAECLIVSATTEWVARDHIARRVFDVPRVSPAHAPLLVARRMWRELLVGDDASALAIEGLTLELIATTARQVAGGHQRAVPPWLRTVRDRLHHDFATPVRLTALAAEAGVHAVHLTRAFRQCFGCSPGEYVRQRRLDRASMDLVASDRSVAEIALDAGFASPSHFATAFRRATGVSPSEFRATAKRGGMLRS
jgi:AraC family transcriptional regulator